MPANSRRPATPEAANAEAAKYSGHSGRAGMYTAVFEIDAVAALARQKSLNVALKSLHLVRFGSIPEGCHMLRRQMMTHTFPGANKSQPVPGLQNTGLLT